MNLLFEFFNSDSFMPHGHCFLWQKNILWLHIISDAGIALSYYFIPLLLFYLIRKRKDLPYKFLFFAFCAFILLCGTTHILDIWVLWHPDYSWQGIVKLLTALVSIGTLFILVKVVPKALLYIPSNSQENAVQLKLLANSLPQLVWMADHQGRIHWYNERWYEYTGMNIATAKDGRWSVHHPEVLSRVKEKWKHSIATGQPFEMVFPLKRFDGVYRSFLTRANPVVNNEGKIIQWFGTNTDITDQEQAVKVIKENEERWRALTEAMPQLVWIDRGSDGWCEYLSKQWEEYTGVAIQQLLGFEWLNVLHPDDRERTRQVWDECVIRLKPYDVEYRIRRYDGTYRWFKARGVPTFNEQGKVDKWYGTCTDIQELVDARQKAEEANLAKTDFLANMSHEIRTPMNAVVGISNLLLRSSPLTEKQKKFITTLQLSADALLSLINDLLDIAKIEASTVEFERIPFVMHDLLNEIDSIMSVRAQEKNLFFRIEQSITTHSLIGDPSRIRQIIFNLCSNAIKFTEQGGVTLSVFFEDLKPDVSVRLCVKVRDSGIGIPVTMHESIFQKFVQADASINRKYGGTGLGLAISKTLTEMLGGSIFVESELGKGSCFTIFMPLELDTGSLIHHENLPYLEEHPLSIGGSLEKNDQRILLVEDNPANVLVASSFLDQFHYSYEVATNGQEALEKFQKGKYALILMDIEMQKMDGFEATRLIRELEHKTGQKAIPIIGMTAYALTGDRERCLMAGMDDYLAKPFNPKSLQEKLRSFLSA